MTEAQQRAYDQAQVMLAFSQGKKVQGKQKQENDTWWQTCSGPVWDFNRFDYRISPEPQEVWLWVKEGHHPIPASKISDPDSDCIHQGYTKKLFREVLDA